MKGLFLKGCHWGLISVFFLSGCRQPASQLENQPSQASEKMESSLSSVSEASQESQEIEATSGASVARRLYQEQIPYPHFSNINNAPAINDFILGYLAELAQIINFEKETVLDYAVLFQNTDFISIVFEGSTISGAYPREVKESLNLNLGEMRRAELSEILAIDEQLTELVADQLIEKLQELGTTYAAVFNQDLADLLIDISQDDSPKGQFVFTSTELTLYFNVQHALGDYLEAKIPLEQLARRL